MGQKVCPIGFRTTVRKNWRSIWYGNKQEFGNLLLEDEQIRRFLKGKACCQGTSKFVIRRTSGKVEVTIHTAKPGLVIGKKGAEIEILKGELKALTGKEVWIEVEEVKRAQIDAQLVGENVARQLEKRLPFRRVMKKAMQEARDAGAIGIKIQVAGRVGGAEIARTEWYREGPVPLHTLRANIDYATARAETTYGSIGVKVWINLGEESLAAAPKRVA